MLFRSKIHKVNGVLKLPLDNGKEVEFRDFYANNNKHKNIITLYPEEYFYKGEDTIHGYYLVSMICGPGLGYLYLINKENGIEEYIESSPSVSPTSKYYSYVFSKGYFLSKSFIKFINFNKKKSMSISLGKRVQFFITSDRWVKWINNDSFIFYLEFYLNKDGNFEPNKYYLVEIKK